MTYSVPGPILKLGYVFQKKIGKKNLLWNYGLSIIIMSDDAKCFEDK